MKNATDKAEQKKKKKKKKKKSNISVNRKMKEPNIHSLD
jgi:hypothetical protein